MSNLLRTPDFQPDTNPVMASIVRHEQAKESFLQSIRTQEGPLPAVIRELIDSAVTRSNVARDARLAGTSGELSVDQPTELH
jgi:hypothetical protein